jgi:hypothetical protein
MTMEQRTRICLIAAIIPTLLVLYRADFHVLQFQAFDYASLAGYLIRIPIGFLFAVVAMKFYPDETNIGRLYYIALAAPSMIATLAGG